MKQKFHRYELWEDWQNGLYRDRSANENRDVTNAKQCLGDPVTCNEMMRQVIRDWPIACEVNLTNRSRNRRAWLGQACCCLFANCPEFTTKLAWHSLQDSQRVEANAIATAVIRDWEIEYLNRGSLWPKSDSE